jgi:RecA-family ATPase
MDIVGTDTPCINISLEEFLKGVFGDADPWLCCATDGADRSGFFGGRASRSDLRGPGWATTNNYYCIGILKPGARSRTNANWMYAPVIVLDDVVEKTDPRIIEECLGEPSYIVQSSPGSQQWGYILEDAITDASVMARIQKALTIAFYGGIDPGQEALVRYMRLPCGVNNKQKYGSPPPQVRLVRWEPELKFHALDFLEALDGIIIEDTRSAWDLAEGAKTNQFEAATVEDLGKVIEGDEVLTAAAELGWVGGMQNSNYVQVLCPLAHTHSKDDESTGWNPVAYSQGQEAFKCHHEAHGGLGRVTTDQFIETVRAAYDQSKGAGAYDKLASEILHKRTRQLFAEMGKVSADEDFSQFYDAALVEAAIKREAADRAEAPGPVSWTEWLASEPAEAFKARRSICSFLARGEVTVLAAQPGTGKSLLGVATAAAMSCDRPEFIGEQQFWRRGSTILISNEDDGEIVSKRRKAWAEHHKIAPGSMQYPGYVNAVEAVKIIEREDRFSPVQWTEQAKQIDQLIDLERVQGRDVALVILDTATTVFRNIEENDNGAQGDAYAKLGQWAQRQNIAILIMHHMPKATGRAGGGGDLGAVRGASAIGGAVRRAMTLVELSPQEKDRLRDHTEKNDWVVLQSAKATNDRQGGARRYFRKVGVDVPVVDEQGMRAYDNVGLLEYAPKGPDFGFDPLSEEAMFRVCEIVARYERELHPIRVDVRRTQMPAAKVIIADEIMDATEEDAQRALKRAVEIGLVEIGEGDLTEHKSRPKVYRVTAAGAELVEERQRQLDGEPEADDDMPF